MPLFDYKCTNCEVVEEQYTPCFEKKESTCLKCGALAIRADQVYAPTIVFNGDGWTPKS